MGLLPRNLYKAFRNTDKLTAGANSLVPNSKRWDEPTYLTFSVFFKVDDISESWRNKTRLTNFDWFPHPLLSTNVQDNYDEREEYSTIQFFRDNNETVREEMLKRFINDLEDIQTYYPWYFQSISGVNELLEVVPERGRRVSKDAKLSFKVLEGIDQKMTNLLNLYRKIAWDDTYQRWMLPDMMRNFVMEIYITEFRTFHAPRISDQGSNTPPENSRKDNFFNRAIDKITNVFKKSVIPEPVDLVLDAVHKTLPTIKIVCERCEFDINSINKNMNDYSVGDIPNQHEVEFDIKIGQVREEYVNPILDYYYSDKVINGKSRSEEFKPQSATTFDELTSGIDGFDLDDEDVRRNDPLRPSTSTFGDVALHNPELAQRELTSDITHTSGTPFYENQNDSAAIHKNLGTDGTPPKGSTLQPDTDPTQPNTWGSNAVKFGTSYLENIVEDKIDEAKMHKIPGLGISLNEAISGIESKDFVTLFGLIKQAIDSVNAQSDAPSEGLDNGIVGDTLRNVLFNISESEATDGDALEIKKFADLALNDDNLFERIIDFSGATSLVGPGETNIPNPIEGATIQSTIADGQDDSNTNIIPSPIIYSGVPSSVATSNPIIGR